MTRGRSVLKGELSQGAEEAVSTPFLVTAT
jgi:hypothetical protein